MRATSWENSGGPDEVDQPQGMLIGQASSGRPRRFVGIYNNQWLINRLGHGTG
jgi:hypothetical protein